jgi:hypothetical protein
MFNHDHTVKTEAGEFMLIQRNAGYADNDGRWVVSQLAELYWSGGGALRQRRAGRFLGAFDTLELAMAAVAAAELQPVDDKMLI